MRFPRQDQIINRIENLNVAVLKKQREAGRSHIQQLWESTKDALRSKIRSLYKHDFPAGVWGRSLAGRRKTLDKMSYEIGQILSDFHQNSISALTLHFKDIYRQSIYRSAYLLDTVTPRSYRVTFPKNRMFTEASAITTYMGPEEDTAWKVRWSSWIDAYHTTLVSNLKLGALNDSTIEDAQDEVDQTRAGTPAYDMGTAFDRIFMYQSVALQAQAQAELADLNDDMEITQVWQTSFSMRVCDICDDQKGLTEEESETDIPAHPNCECYWRLVPASWAELLRNGDAEEVDLAKWMDGHAIVPGAMVVRNNDGDEVGKMIVSFETWIKGQPMAVTAQ